MFVGIKYLGRNGQHKQFTVRRQEEVTFGSSRRADFMIESEPGLSDVHFVVAYRDRAWQVAGYGANSFKHNGHNVVRCLLSHGDRITAGEAEFEIAMQSARGAASATPVELTEDPREELQPERIDIITIPKGLISKAEIVAISDIPRLLASMGELRNLYLLFNRKRFGDQETFGLIASTHDLIENAPSEIRSTDSLELIAVKSSEVALSAVKEALASDSGVLLVSSKEEGDLKESMKLFWGWFLRPSILNHHLEHGSEFLTTKLLASIDTLLILPKGGAKWTFWGIAEPQGQLMSEISESDPLVTVR